MTSRRVIAYVMHDAERDLAAETLADVVSTDSYVVGEGDEAGVHSLEQAGLVVEELPSGGAARTAARARGALASQHGSPGWRAGSDDDLPPAEPGVPTQWLARIDSPLLAAIRQALDSTGARLEEYVPPHAYVLTATPEQAVEVVNLPFVASVDRYGPAVTGPIVLTAAPGATRSAEDERARTWDLWLSEESAREPILGWLSQRNVEVVGSGHRKIRLAIGADPELRRDVSTLPGVLSMVEHVPPKLYNDLARVQLGVSTAEGAPDLLPYTGDGEVVGVADTGLQADHPDLKGRLVGVVPLGRPGDFSDPNGHGTHVAGSVLGDGSASHGGLRGVAPGAGLYFQSLLDSSGGLGGLPVSLHDLFEPAYQAGARIHNNSWGAPTGSAYTVDANEVDSYVAERRDLLVVVAAGNEGSGVNPFNARPGFVDWLSISSPASCKNALTVGAVRSSRTTGGLSGRTYRESWPHDFPAAPIAEQHISGDPEAMAAFSSRGPCDDERIKPDVVAPGTDIVSTRSQLAPDQNFWGRHDNPEYAYLGGTSMACPLVAGCAALVREYYVKERAAAPSAALLKATLVNGARWLSAEDSVADHPDRPNYHQGFGAVFLPSTLPNRMEPELRLEFVDSWQDRNRQLAESGTRLRFDVSVLAGLPLRMCLAYTDLPGRALQNDLSLLVEDPTGQKIPGNLTLPRRLGRSDNQNNVEVLRLAEPPPGRYLVQVFARNLLRGPQDFALVVTGRLDSQLRRVPG